MSNFVYILIGIGVGLILLGIQLKRKQKPTNIKKINEPLELKLPKNDMFFLYMLIDRELDRYKHKDIDVPLIYQRKILGCKKIHLELEKILLIENKKEDNIN